MVWKSFEVLVCFLSFYRPSEDREFLGSKIGDRASGEYTSGTSEAPRPRVIQLLRSAKMVDTPGKVRATSLWHLNPMGILWDLRRAFGKSKKSVQKYPNPIGTPHVKQCCLQLFVSSCFFFHVQILLVRRIPSSWFFLCFTCRYYWYAACLYL